MMKKSMDKIKDLLISVALIIFLIFMLLMYLSGNMSFEKGVHDNREDRPTMEEVDALLNELTDSISSEKDEFVVRKVNVVYKRYRYENPSEKEQLYLKNIIDSSSKWVEYDHEINRGEESFYYCYNQFELIFTRDLDINTNDRSHTDNSFAVSVGWGAANNNVCRGKFLATG